MATPICQVYTDGYVESSEPDMVTSDLTKSQSSVLHGYWYDDRALDLINFDVEEAAFEFSWEKITSRAPRLSSSLVPRPTRRLW